MREVLERESVDLSNLQMAVKLVLEDLGAPVGEGTSQLVPQLLQSVHGARDEVKQALHFGVQRSFAIACTHYVNIDLQEMSGVGARLRRCRAGPDRGPLAHVLAEKMEDEVALKK